MLEIWRLRMERLVLHGDQGEGGLYDMWMDCHEIKQMRNQRCLAHMEVALYNMPSRLRYTWSRFPASIAGTSIDVAWDERRPSNNNADEKLGYCLVGFQEKYSTAEPSRGNPVQDHEHPELR